MTTLVIGGTGKIGEQLVKLLQAADKPYIVTSRNGDVPPTSSHTVKFDWSDASTFENPFLAAPEITNLYLTSPPGSADPLATVTPLIDLAVSKGVKKVLLVSASQMEKGGPFIGKIHEYLDGLNIDYTVLRPTWFIDNLSAGHLPTIKKDGKIWSYAGDGRIPFVSAEDIAQAVFDAFFNDKAVARGRQPIVLGPEPFSYDEVASILSEVTGRKIVHVKLAPNEPRQPWIDAKLPESFQAGLRFMELNASKGSEEGYFTGEKDKIIGKKTLREYVEENKALWV